MPRKAEIKRITSSTGDASRFILNLTEKQLNSRIIFNKQKTYLHNFLSCILIGQALVEKNKRKQNYLIKNKCSKKHQLDDVNDFLSKNVQLYLTNKNEVELIEAVQTHFKDQFKIV